MAPTEILAQQHFETLGALLEPAGLEVGLLTGRGRAGNRRRSVLAALASGALPVVVGTHALFQEAVTFADLRLAVIDEQHRFGVEQRLALTDKGRDVHTLAMTATPHPANPADDGLWRPRHFRASTRSRPAASRSRRACCAWSNWTGSWSASAQPSAPGAAPTGSAPAGGGERQDRRRRRGSALRGTAAGVRRPAGAHPRAHGGGPQGGPP